MFLREKITSPKFKDNLQHTLWFFLLISCMLACLGLIILAAALEEDPGVICRGGFKFAEGTYGGVTQILDAQGHGIPCDRRQ